MAGRADLKSFPQGGNHPGGPSPSHKCRALHPEARGPLASTASNTQVRLEHDVFLAWTPSAQLLQEGLRAHSFPERSQELNKATRGLENKGEGEVPDNPKMRSLPPSRPPFQLWQPGKLAVTWGWGGARSVASARSAAPTPHPRATALVSFLFILTTMVSLKILLLHSKFL